LKLNCTFQTHPVDIDKEQFTDVISGSTYTRLKPSDFKSFVKKTGDVESNYIHTKSNEEMDKKLEKVITGEDVPDKEWRELHIVRMPFAMLTNHSDKKINSDIPEVPLKHIKSIEKFNRLKNKVFCFTPGVILFKQLFCAGDHSVAISIYNVLKNSGIEFEHSGNDFEINGRKFFGCIEHMVTHRKIYGEYMLTFDYDDEIFKNLPYEYYTRSYKDNKVKCNPGITGLLNEYPNLNMNTFLDELLALMGYV